MASSCDGVIRGKDRREGEIIRALKAEVRSLGLAFRSKATKKELRELIQESRGVPVAQVEDRPSLLPVIITLTP